MLITSMTKVVFLLNVVSYMTSPYKKKALTTVGHSFAHFFFFCNTAASKIDISQVPDPKVQKTILDATQFNDKTGISSQCK